MADVVNKANPELGVKRSVNTPEFPEAEWFINPVLPPVEPKYWKNDAGTLAEMTQPEKDAVDAAEAAALKATTTEGIRSSLASSPMDGVDFTVSTSGLDITVEVPSLDINDVTTVVADGSLTKLVQILLVLDTDIDEVVVVAQERTDGAYAPLAADEVFVSRLAEYSVDAGGSTLTEV